MPLIAMFATRGFSDNPPLLKLRKVVEQLPEPTRLRCASARFSWCMRLAMFAVIYFAAASSCRAESQFVAETHDGKRVTGTRIDNWQKTDSQPTLSGQKLFDGDRPVQWIVNQDVTVPGTPAAYVEFIGGDRLPGLAIQSVSRSATPFLRQPEHLVVETVLPIGFRQQTSRLQVSTRWLRRVVWQAERHRKFTSRTVFLRDGRQLSFDALRWSGEQITLLRTQGVESLSFGEIAEIHLGEPDRWQAYIEQVARVLPGGRGRLVRIETSDGLRVTTARERMAPYNQGDKKRQESWWVRAQPAWSLQPLGVQIVKARSWRVFEVSQPPLSLFPPQAVQQHSTFGSGWTLQNDRSVRGEALQTGDAVFADGYGVHASCALDYSLSPLVTSFRSRFGLDQSAGEGGCVAATVAVHSSGQPGEKWTSDRNRPQKGVQELFASDPLVGSSRVVDSGWLKIPAQAKTAARPRFLRLTVDALATQRPDGADPFDIRDHANWLQPTFQLDADRLAEQVRQHALLAVPELSRWSCRDEDLQALRWHAHWDQTYETNPVSRQLVAVAAPFVTYTRKLTVGPRDRWLVLAISRPFTGHSPRIQVRVDGRALAEFSPPLARVRQEAIPVLVPISAFRGRSVPVEIVQFGHPSALNKQEDPPRETAIDFRGISTAVHRPTLRPLFDENADLVEQLTFGDGMAQLELNDPYRGERSLRVTGESAKQPSVTGWAFPIAEKPRLGEFRYLRFAWKKDGGRQIALELGHDQRLGGDLNGQGKRRFVGRKPVNRNPLVRRGNRLPRQPQKNFGRGLEFGYRYGCGRTGLPVEVGYWLDRKLPEDWRMQSCDLYNDFGEFTLTGLGLISTDEGTAWFDAVYIARSPDDFRLLDDSRYAHEKSQPNVIAWERQPEDFGLVLAERFPDFTCRDAIEGVHSVKDWGGQAHVIVTRPESPTKPCVFTAAVEPPRGSRWQLKLNVAAEAGRKWRLKVKANDRLLESRVIESNEKIVWHSVTVDLQEFAGQQLVLEVHNASENNKQERAQWQELQIVRQ